MYLRIAGASLIIIALIAGSCAEAFAATKSTKDGGLVNCYIWCNEHNKTDASIIRCENQCEKYYGPGGLGGGQRKP